MTYQDRWRIFDTRHTANIRQLQAKLTTALRMEENTIVRSNSNKGFYIAFVIWLF